MNIWGKILHFSHTKKQYIYRYTIGFFVFFIISGFLFSYSLNNVYADENTIDIDVTKEWQDNNDADGDRPSEVEVLLKKDGEEIKRMTLKASEDWKGAFKDVPRYDEDNQEIQYTVEEVPVEGYLSTVEQGEMISTYEYPSNVSTTDIDLSTSSHTPINATGGTKYKINQYITQDKIEGTQIVFNQSKMNISLATFTEYDADNNLVPSDERVFEKSSNVINFRPKGTLVMNTVISTDHYYTLTFKDAVTVLDGTAEGSTHDVTLKVFNVSVARTINRSYQRVMSGALSAGPGSSTYAMGGLSFDVNFKIAGVNDGNVLISFTDVDVTANTNSAVSAGGDRREAVYLLDGFDDTIYTVKLSSTSPTTRTPYTFFAQTASGNYFRAYAAAQDGAGTLNSGFITRANISEDGFTLRWTGTSCGTALFSQVRPFRLKVTVDEKTANYQGGTISEIGEWRYRDYGDPQLITATPDENYHIKTLKIDGNEVDLDGFDENGEMTINTGYSTNTGKEDVKLYQRENGVVDIYLPPQYYAVGSTAPARTDHWVDVSYESNGVASTYTIKNIKKTTVVGSKTWVAGNASHVSNEELNLTLKQNDKEYAYDKTTQLVWNDNIYSINDLPKYDKEGNAYKYEVSETPVSGYDLTTNGNSFVNTLKQEKITVQGRKTWRDGGKTHNNKEDLTVSLYRATTTDGTRYSYPEKIDLEPTWDGNTYKFENLDKYDDKRYEYRYTVHEELNDSLLNSLDDGDTYVSAPDDTGRNFVNTLTGTTKFTGTKTWLEGESGTTHNNAEDVRLVLYWESENVAKRNTGGQYTPTWDGNTYTYENLPKYDSQGYPYTYSVRENQVNGVNSGSAKYDIFYDGELWDKKTYTVTGKDITNLRKELIDITGTKTWIDVDKTKTHDNEKELTLTLKRKSKKEGSSEETVDATVKWDGDNYTFEGVDKYDEDGYTYDYTVEEDKVDNYKTTQNGNNFINRYQAKGSIELKATKNLVGRVWKNNETFTFSLLDETGQTVDTKKVSSNSTITFDKIDYDQDDIGEKTYTITESSTLPNNVEKSDPIEVTVTIKDNGDGTLSTSAKYTNDDTITNTYTPTPVNATLTVNKEIDGYIKGSDATFEFELYDENNKKIDTVSFKTEDGKGSQAFKDLTFTKQGTYHYTVKEKAGSTAGYAYNDGEFKVTIEVTDDLDGKLSTNITYGDDATDINVINKYKEESIDVTLHLTKKIEDQSNSASDGTFTFKLLNTDGSEVQSKEVTTKNLEGKVDFDKITYEKSGTYHYILKEVNDGQAGYTYDEKDYPVTITVKDNFETAKLEATVNIDGTDTPELTVTNVYKAAKTSTVLQLIKVINDKSASAPDETFTFTLSEDGKTIDTKSIKGAGKVSFDEIIYEKAGTYHYTIKEVKGNKKGYQYDETEYPVIVTVVDKNGKLVATADYGENKTSLDITNTYDPTDTSVTLEMNKVVKDSTDGAPDETFNFELLDSDKNVIDTTSRENGGPISFKEIEYDKVGTYTYYIREVEGSTKGYEYDTTLYKVTVKVTDNDGELIAKVNYDDGDEITNTFSATAVTDDPPVKKVIEGDKPTKDTDFTFVLEAVNTTANVKNMPMPEGIDRQSKSVTITGEGEKEFGVITFKKVGTYTYSVYEKNTNTSQYTYDDSEYIITYDISVKDGELVSKRTVTKNGEEYDEAVFTFTNTYESPKPHLTVNKTVTSTPKNGKTYVEGETVNYTITVMNDGNVVIKDILVNDELTGDEWIIKQLAPQQLETYTTSHTITKEEAESGSVENVATANGQYIDKDESPDGTPVEGNPGKVTVSTEELPEEADVEITDDPEDDEDIKDETPDKETKKKENNVETSDPTSILLWMMISIISFLHMMYLRKRDA